MDLNFLLNFLCGYLVFKKPYSKAQEWPERDVIKTPNINTVQNCHVNPEGYQVCNNHLVNECKLSLLDNDCTDEFVFDDFEKICKFKDKTFFDLNLNDKTCLYGEANPNECLPYDYKKTCGKYRVFTVRPVQACILNPKIDIDVKTFNEESVFVDKKINTKDYFYIQTKNIYNLRIHLYFNKDEEKIEKLEKLIQLISTKLMVYYMAVSSYVESGNRNLQIEVEKWCLKKSIEDYYYYNQSFEENIGNIKIGRENAKIILNNLKLLNPSNAQYFGDINLFISSFDVLIRTVEPEFKIYYQDPYE